MNIRNQGQDILNTGTKWQWKIGLVRSGDGTDYLSVHMRTANLDNSKAGPFVLAVILGMRLIRYYFVCLLFPCSFSPL